MTCVHFGRDQICTKVDASFLPLTHPPHVIPMWVKFICCKGNLLANERQPWTPWNGVLLAICLYLRVPMANQRKSALKFDWRSLASPSLASAYRRSKALGKPWSTKNYSLTLPQWKSLSHRSSMTSRNQGLSSNDQRRQRRERLKTRLYCIWLETKRRIAIKSQSKRHSSESHS